MKLQYLGTAAAEGFPGIFCACEACENARKKGGKNIRTRSQAIINDELLIDFPADTYFHVLTYGLDFKKIRHCIITHPHSDHFYPADFEMREAAYAVVTDNIPLTVYGTETVKKETDKMINEYNLSNEARIESVLVKPFSEFTAGKYRITPLPANHAAEIQPVVYIISDGISTMLYAHDTGIFEDNVWSWLSESGIKFNFVSVDCTAGMLTGWRSGHLGLDTCREFRDMLENTGTADSGTVFCLNHFSHNGLADYDKMLTEAAKYGFDVSYDGKTVHF